MTREELEHRINVQTLKQVEDHIVHQEVTKRTYPQQQTGTGELSRLWALHEEYVEKVRTSEAALKTAAVTDPNFVRVGAVASPKVAIREE